MVSLVDIVPQKRSVTTASGDLELRGLGLRQIADLLLRFPNLRKLFVAGAPELTIEELLLAAPDALGSIVAEAAGQPEAAENIANGAISLDDLAECLAVVSELTMPSGAGPFMERLGALLGGGSLPSGKGPATNMPPRRKLSSPQDMQAAK